MPEACCYVPGCSNRRTSDEFPRDAATRRQWTHTVRRQPRSTDEFSNADIMVDQPVIVQSLRDQAFWVCRARVITWWLTKALMSNTALSQLMLLIFQRFPEKPINYQWQLCCETEKLQVRGSTLNELQVTSAKTFKNSFKKSTASI